MGRLVALILSLWACNLQAQTVAEQLTMIHNQDRTLVGHSDKIFRFENYLSSFQIMCEDFSQEIEVSDALVVNYNILKDAGLAQIDEGLLGITEDLHNAIERIILLDVRTQGIEVSEFNALGQCVTWFSLYTTRRLRGTPPERIFR